MPRAAGLRQLGPFFLIRREDGAVNGEIGAALDGRSATAYVGYSVVRSRWGEG